MTGVQDRVIVVTGAGGGLGREYALTLAREGACVVVNDLGVGLKGEKEDAPSPAEQVVAEIEALGRRAFVRPADLAISAAGRLFVSQMRNRGVAVFTLSPPAERS